MPIVQCIRKREVIMNSRVIGFYNPTTCQYPAAESDVHLMKMWGIASGHASTRVPDVT